MNKKKHNSISASGVWLTVVLLAVLILASVALLASFIKGYVAGEKNVISIIADSAAMGQLYQDGDLPVGAEPEMVASWETETSVDLFKTAYTGPDGTVTVQSSNGDSLIAPGTSNVYEFTLKNTGNIALDYTLVLNGVFRLQNHELPMFVRLRQGDRWIFGGESQWIHVDDMPTLEEHNTVARGQSVVYLFEWQWPYEITEEMRDMLQDFNDNLIAADMTDTTLGSFTASANTQFHLNISVDSGISAGAIAEFEDGTSVLNRFILVCSMSGLILGSGIWLILLLLLRRKVYFTGIVTPAAFGTVTLGKQEADLDAGRFVFEKVSLGKHKLSLPGGQLELRFKRAGNVPGLTVSQEDGVSVIRIGRKVRAVELYFACLPGKAAVRQELWAAIDKQHTVYTDRTVIPPVNGENRTPGGLSVDRDGEYSVEKAVLHV